MNNILSCEEHVAGNGDPSFSVIWLHGLGADGGHDDRAARPLDDGGAQNPLQFLHTGAEGGLADVGGLGGAGEAAVFGQKLQILELTQGRKHGRQIGRVYTKCKDNRLAL